MGRQLAGTFASLFVLLCFTSLAWGVVGTLNVTVRDAATGQPVPHTKIKLTPQAPDLPEKEGETDENGKVGFLLEEGSYTARVSSRDYVTATTQVVVRGGQTTLESITLTQIAQALPTIEAVSPKAEPTSKFRVKLEGRVVSQERNLSSPFIMGEFFERAILSTGTLSTREERLRISKLDERGRAELAYLTLFYRVTDRLEIHGKIGGGQLVSRLANLKGKVLVEEFLDSSLLFSTTYPFNSTETFRGTGDPGVAAGAGFDFILYRIPRPNLSMILSSQWTYLQSDNVVKLSEFTAIDESRTHLVDVGLKALLQRGRLSAHAGVMLSWLLTTYEGHFTRFEIESCGCSTTITTTAKKFSFDVEPRAFPILGVLGLDYAITNSFGVQLEGAAGNSDTYSVTGGAFYRW